MKSFFNPLVSLAQRSGVVAGCVLCAIVCGGKPPMRDADLVVLRSAAQRGDHEAEFLLGMQLKAGDGVEQNITEAAAWLRKAAEAGQAEAQNALGSLQAARGEPGDAADAAKWLQASAGQGNAEAMLNLAALYAGNPGLSPDPAEAVRWYVKAADAGQAGACTALAEIYAGGQGGAHDPVLALHWYRKGAELGDDRAKQVLGRIAAVTKAVTEDPGKALAGWRAEAEKGDLGASLALELMAVRARALDEDPAETARWSLLLSGLRGPEALLVRGLLLENGIAVNRDLPAAALSYRKAAEAGHVLGQLRLGRLYAEGRGVTKDPVEAAVWLTLAAEKGSAEAAAELTAMQDRLSEEQRETVARLTHERAAKAKQAQ